MGPIANSASESDRFLLGRDEELARLHAALTAARDGGSAVLVVRGEAGVGKSALLTAVREAASGFRVLAAAGAEAESDLPFAGLSDLLRPLLDGASGLPDVQAQALAAALGMGPPVAGERFTCYVAATALLARAAREGPVLVLVDDLQWLDGGSREALLFMARRLGADSIAMLVGIRDGEGADLEVGELPELRLRGLDRDASLELLERAWPGMAPSVGQALWAETDGNPLALLEIPRQLSAAQLAGRASLQHPIPLSTNLERVFAGRVKELPADARRALVVAAASYTGRMDAVGSALAHLQLPADALEPAEAAGLLTLPGGQLRWRHPLLRSAVYQRASGPERRAAHHALALAAGAESLADHRAWHVAAAASAPDEAIAEQLEELAERARSRGALTTVARALEEAARLSVDEEQRARRVLLAAEAAVAVGGLAEAQALVDEARNYTDAPLLIARLERVQARVEILWGVPEVAHHRLVEAAERVVEHDIALAAAMMADAVVAHMATGKRSLYMATASRAMELGSQVGGAAEAVAGLVLGAGHLADGNTDEALRLLETYGTFARSPEVWMVGPEIVGMYAFCHVWIERFDVAEPLLVQMVGTARTAGALRALAYPLAILAVLHLRLGRWPAALGAAAEAADLADDSREGAMLAHNLSVLALVEASLGRVEETREHAAKSIELSRTLSLGAIEPYALQALSLLSLSLGDPAATIDHLEGIDWEVSGWTNEPGLAQWNALLIEAYIQAGRIEDADRALGELAGWSQRTQRTWGCAVVARYRGMLGSDDELDAHFEQALDWHRQAPMPFELARTQLLYGERLRRTRRRSDARRQLARSLTTFEALGAALWARRAREGLAAAGAPVPPQRRTSPWLELTPAETRVAEAIVSGSTYQEAAIALFLSPRTVEHHLRQAYRKLGIRSRSELTRLLAHAVETP